METSALIRRYIDEDADGRGPAGARLAEYGTPVWSLIAYLEACHGNLAEVAADYEVPVEAVEAAVAFYERHKASIDARLRLNAMA